MSVLSTIVSVFAAILVLPKLKISTSSEMNFYSLIFSEIF
jgi:hypothetical protein